MVAYFGSSNHHLAVAAASVANQLSQGEQSATTLADYRTLRETEKVRFPRDISEVFITLSRYAVLCQCLFQGAGLSHPFVDAMWSAAATLQNLAPYVSDRFHALARQPAIARTYFPRILRAIQLAARDYFHGVSIDMAGSVVGVPVPDLASLFQELKRGTFHQSTNWIDLPDNYMEPLPSPPLPTANAPAPSGSTIATQASTRTGVSMFTQDTSPPNGGRHQSGQSNERHGVHRHHLPTWRRTRSPPNAPPTGKRRRP